MTVDFRLVVRDDNEIRYAAGNSGQMGIKTISRLCTADFENDLDAGEVV
jgi:hypothetical protein